ncbi:MAG: hypothetical protein QG646_129, partial [Euryarchaeota archaeon]|nr:hypothetical protein [Euryarchaeota archaeon]
MERNKLVNRIINGDALEVLKEFPSNFIDCVVTSPPYWLLRDYGIGPVIWDGDPNCSHKFNTVHRLHSPQGNQGQAMNNHPNGQSNFCLNCGAWRGQLGLEPTLDLYIKHLCNIFDEIYRVLKDTGSCWVNLGDTYTGNVGKRNGWTDEKGIYLTNKTEIIHQLPQKCLAGIPFRFAIEMVNRGWILRNTLIWHKPNCLPSSAKDRFTVDFEYLFFFVK